VMTKSLPASALSETAINSIAKVYVVDWNRKEELEREGRSDFLFNCSSFFLFFFYVFMYLVIFIFSLVMFLFDACIWFLF
jgi:hypothetical protein